MKKIKFNPKVHYSVKNRKAWKTKMLLLFILLVIVLIGCSAMMGFGSVKWDPEKGFSPRPSDNVTWWQELLIIAGAVIALGGMFLYIWYAIKQFKGFYATQEAYFKSKEFAQNKKHATDLELFKLKPKDLKWYKKLGYINAADLKKIKDDQKAWILSLKQQRKKINYAQSRA